MFVKLAYSSLPVAISLAARIDILPINISWDCASGVAKLRLEPNTHVIPTNVLLAVGFISKPRGLLFSPRNFIA